MRQRPAGGRLADLDARVVPRVARVLRRVGDLQPRADGKPVGTVRRLARREPMMVAAFVVVVLAAALLLATGAGRTHRAAPALPLTVGPPTAPSSNQPSARSAPGQAPPATLSPPTSQLGPSVGEGVTTYRAAAAQRAALLRTASPSSSVTAVIDLTGYLTPAVVVALLNRVPGLQLTGAFAEAAPPATGDVHALTLTPAVDLVAALRSVRASARTIVRNDHRLRAAARRHPTPRARRAVHAYRDLGREAAADLAGLGPGRGCVFAVVVEGSAAGLLRLADDPQVRIVDPDSTGVAMAALRIVPLQPQVTGAVPAGLRRRLRIPVGAAAPDTP